MQDCLIDLNFLFLIRTLIKCEVRSQLTSRFGMKTQLRLIINEPIEIDYCPFQSIQFMRFADDENIGRVLLGVESSGALVRPSLHIENDLGEYSMWVRAMLLRFSEKYIQSF